MHFPDLANGGVTIAITVNDVLRGRSAAAELAAEVLAEYGNFLSATLLVLGVTRTKAVLCHCCLM